MYHVRTLATGVAGSPWYINMYFKDSAGYGAQDAATAVQTFWASMAGVISQQISFSVNSLVPRVDPTDGSTSAFETVTTSAVQGQSATPPAPYSSQGLIRLNTSGVVRNRRVQGRIFVPGLVGASTIGGVPNATIVTALQDAADGLLDDEANVQLQVWSRPKELDTLPLPPILVPGSAHDVTSAQAREFWAVLRSRRD